MFFARFVKMVFPSQVLRLCIECPTPMQSTMHIYEVRHRKDHRGVDLISDVLPFGHFWYAEPDAVSNAIDYAKFRPAAHIAL